jgi:hypothetical protein
LERAAEDVEASGACWQLLQAHASGPLRSVPLLFLACVHRLVLEEKLPQLARVYPSPAGRGDPDAAWPALLDALVTHSDLLHERFPKTVQTNEVTRCCALLPGFLEIARSTGLPLGLLEIGCSAGLNLLWDQYRYESDGWAWGNERSSVIFRDCFLEPPSASSLPVEVWERRGCDVNPIDPTTGDGRLTLLSFVWADQRERFDQLDKAIALARSIPVAIARADAAEWLANELNKSHTGAARVVFHSIVLPYLSDDTRQRVTQQITEAGERATRQAPLAWLSMEPGADQADVHLTLWPGGERRLIATSGFHGRGVRVLAIRD